MKHISCLVILGGTLMLGACNKANPPEADQSKRADTPAALSDEAVERTDLPVKEDFEETAYTSISEENLDQRVTTLAEEIELDQE